MTFISMPHCTSSDISTCLPGTKTPVCGSCGLCIVVFEPLLHERVCTATVLDQQCSRRRRPPTASFFLLILIGRWICILYTPDRRLVQANRLKTRLTTARSFILPSLPSLAVDKATARLPPRLSCLFLLSIQLALYSLHSAA